MGQRHHVAGSLDVCILHPLAVVLAWIDLARRQDQGALATVAWAVFPIVPIVPFPYVLVGGQLWGPR